MHFFSLHFSDKNIPALLSAPINAASAASSDSNYSHDLLALIYSIQRQRGHKLHVRNEFSFGLILPQYFCYVPKDVICRKVSRWNLFSLIIMRRPLAQKFVETHKMSLYLYKLCSDIIATVFLCQHIAFMCPKRNRSYSSQENSRKSPKSNLSQPLM